MAASSSPTADDAPRPSAVAAPSRARRAVLGALAAFLIYGNAVVALQPPLVRRSLVQLPAPRWLRDAFLMSGMFTSWSRTNLDMVLAGLRTDTGEPGSRGQWIELPLREHFPDRHGVTFTKLFAMHHWDVYGAGAQHRAWKALAKKLRARHNRLHPERAVRRVRFGSVEWPQSPEGYRARKLPGQIEARVWFEERS